jgi:rhodanese-related sulfurtransferase
MYLDVINFILNIVIIFSVLFTLRKIRKIHQWTFKNNDDLANKSGNVISQIEALLGLYTDLNFKKSIPKTRGWAGSPDFLWNIARLAQGNKPQLVLECSSGVSTVVLAQALKLNGSGHVYSLDHDPLFAEKTREELKRHGLKNWATVIDAPLVDYEIKGEKWRWYSMSNLPDEIKIDLLVIDGPPASVGNLARYPAGPLLFKSLNEKGMIALDDADRNHEKQIFKLWHKEFSISRVAADPGEKGFALFQVK